MSDETPLFPVSREHLDALTGGVAIMQHAIGADPDPAHGYCTDDVARALQVDLLHQRPLGWDAVASSAWRNLTFLDDAFDRTTGRFRNFRRIDGSWLDGAASEDSQGRAMLALGSTIAAAPDEAMVGSAWSLFARALPAAQGVRALRAQSSVLLACDAVVRAAPLASHTAYAALAHHLLSSRLASTFRARATSDWRWPETRLTYENALPARALIVAGRSLGSQPMLELGLDVLDWLIVSQTDQSGHLSPIGNGWWPRGGEKSRFDQQPIEATALLLAAESAYEATGDAKYPAAMERAYAWFLGENDLHVPVAVPERGACFDGLIPRGVNANQGAESTLMWLIAAERTRALRADHGVADHGGAQPATEALLVAAAR
jgi:hypothetical protein